ncbi:MAG: maleylpyruvate isomerase family mycothiol-dependent enzyme [Micromonosporaceae bacterium]|nr:maleylpyruvate isomerase family mycothiol-dependent enzyme [Micromonosporaceae bacterium]
MDYPAFLRYLAGDFARLREVARDNLTNRVPSCPEWTVYDLVDHVAVVYLQKVECMRLGHRPQSWPPEFGDEPVLERLDRGFAALMVEFGTRDAGSPGGTWYEPDPTVGFWARRMAHETLIHRIDAELAAGAGAAPIPAELALDGIDEVLECFLRYGSRAWREDFVADLPTVPAPPVLIASGDRGWLVRAAPEGVLVEPGSPVAPGSGRAAARIEGGPADVLRWLWRRDPLGTAPATVGISGDTGLVEQLRGLLYDATQ